jgi:hypothetical protein
MNPVKPLLALVTALVPAGRTRRLPAPELSPEAVRRLRSLRQAVAVGQ